MPGSRRQPVTRVVIALAVAALAALSLAGCVARAGGTPAIQLATAYVPVPQAPHTTVAYVVIRNNGGADRLTGASTSAGGRVRFQVAYGPGAKLTRTVTAIPIPAHSTVKMVPDGTRMLITGIGPVRGGKDITLTLVFARAGRVSVRAPVIDPGSDSGYF
jgi:copper(I)-binding protein